VLYDPLGEDTVVGVDVREVDVEGGLFCGAELVDSCDVVFCGGVPAGGWGG